MLFISTQQCCHNWQRYNGTQLSVATGPQLYGHHSQSHESRCGQGVPSCKDFKMAEQKGTTAYLVLKRHFTRLLDIPPGEIADFLYSDSVITLNDLEHATNQLFTSKDRTRKLLMSLQKAVKRNHEHLEHFCDFLIERNPALGYSEIAHTIKGGN